ncbi:MAG: flagellar basal body-associated protein FliL [Methylophilus sp.]
MAQAPKQEAAEAEVVAAPPNSSKKKMIIMIVAALVLLGGGGAAAWYFMGHKSPEKAAAEGKHEAEKEAEHEAAKAPVFLALETFTVNLQPDPDEKFLQVDVTIQVASAEVAEKLKVQMPAVRNRMLMLLTSKQASEISNAEGKEALSQEILAELQKPYAKGGKPEEVTSVLFTSFVIQ